MLDICKSTGGFVRTLSTFALIVALTGCTSTRWYKDNTSDQEFYQDEYSCQQEAQQQTSSAYVNAYGGAAQSGSSLNWQLFKSCMYARGYRETSAKSRNVPKSTTAPQVAIPSIAECTQKNSWRNDEQFSSAYCNCVSKQLSGYTTAYGTTIATHEGTCLNEYDDNGRMKFLQKYGAGH